MAAGEGRSYAGNVTPQEAIELAAAGLARIVDVRTPEERKFVGYVPDSVHVAWMTGTALVRNPRFVRELEGKTPVRTRYCCSCAEVASVPRRRCKAATRAQFEECLRRGRGFRGRSPTIASVAAPRTDGDSTGCLGSKTKTIIPAIAVSPYCVGRAMVVPNPLHQGIV